MWLATVGPVCGKYDVAKCRKRITVQELLSIGEISSH